MAFDWIMESLDLVKNNSHELNDFVQRAKAYKCKYLYSKNIEPTIKLLVGNVKKKMDLGHFDSVIQIGCFACLDTVEEFEKAVDHTYHYLNKNGTLLMVNWLDEKHKVLRPYHFNGKVNCRTIYKSSMEKAGFKVLELHTTSNLSKETKKMGYTRIIWAVAKK